MMILIPMAGEGQRFVKAGYKVHKPMIEVIDRKTGKTKPMVICAVQDLPGVEKDGSNLLFIDREFHKNDGVEAEIKKYYEEASFITAKELTEGQASTCLLAKESINNDDELLISACDNGLIINVEKFEAMKDECDVIVYTHRHHRAVLENPNAYGWVKVNGEDVSGVSVKRVISDNPLNDHAIVATFWFRKGSIFVQASEKMIRENDRVNNEFYVDEVIEHLLQLNYKVKVFEVEKYICWGTPEDYANYMNTIKYWSDFLDKEPDFMV